MPVRVIYIISCSLSYFLLAAIWVVIGLFLVIQHGRYNVTTIQLNSPYKIESKAAIITILYRARAEYIDEWLPIISTYIKLKEKTLYLDIEKKLPKEDLLLDMLLYLMNNLSEDYACSDCSYTVSRVKNFLNQIKYKHSVRGANMYWKPEYTNKIVFNLLSKYYKSYNEKQSNLEELRSYIRDMLYDDRDKDDPLYNFKQLLLIEAECAILKKMLLNLYPEQSEKWCNAKEYKTWYKVVDEVYPDVIQLNSDPVVMGTYIAKNSIKYIKNQKEELDNFDKEYCKIK